MDECIAIPRRQLTALIMLVDSGVIPTLKPLVSAIEHEPEEKVIARIEAMLQPRPQRIKAKARARQ